MGTYDNWKDKETIKEIEDLIDKQLKPINRRIYELEVRQNVIQKTQNKSTSGRLLNMLPVLLIAFVIAFLTYVSHTHDIKIFVDGNLISP